MGKVFFYCDESGSKGYANQSETYPGETGVFAGILVPEERKDSALSRFEEIARRFETEDGKLHVADLHAEQQQKLREALYSAIRIEGLPCFWYAVHVQGFHAFHESQKSLLAKLREESGMFQKNSRFRPGSPREESPSLHVELFGGLYGRAVAFLMERNQTGVELIVRTDHVDSAIARQFEEASFGFTDEEPTISHSTAFDSIEKKVVRGTISTSVDWPDELKLSKFVASFSIETVRDVDGLVLAADVLANSINYLFKKREPTELYGPLNSIESVAAHPLADHLNAFRNWGQGDIMGDRLYAHPEARPFQQD